MSEIKYKRIMLKVSGEALAGGAPRGLDFDVINSVCTAIKECVDMGVQVGLMVGAGNFWRGVKDGADKMQRSHADAMGMLGTVMNSIAVADALCKHGLDARVLCAVEMNKFCEYFTRDLADRYLNEGEMFVLYDPEGRRQIYCDLKDIQETTYEFDPSVLDGIDLVAARFPRLWQAGHHLRRGGAQRQDAVYRPFLFLLGHEFLLLRQLVCKQLHTGLGCGKFGLGI